MNRDKMKHKLTIISKKKADNMIVNSLFNRGGTLTAEKYDSGKYVKSNIGKEIELPIQIKALYPVRKQDKDGAYYQLYCLV